MALSVIFLPIILVVRVAIFYEQRFLTRCVQITYVINTTNLQNLSEKRRKNHLMIN